ncbi:hypothetical protein JOQ06_029874 [Pogonophryne albipinna]|uniref:Ig-like domain-containing protein n=1 Tax=Pogonophryne albipinna TaxID=1090488 RepID=A0AAD6AXV5_9TELE|nr:hypothetical protein JOQ06_029874 [Pogonophryne albipinna]
MVRSGATYKTVPQHNVTVSCPVKHCGEPISVTWCKLDTAIKWDQIKYKENLKITQTDIKDELISYLTFTRITSQDDGLYRCSLKGYESEQISHSINVSVSGIMTFHHTKGKALQERSNQMMPNLPSASAPSIFYLHDINYSPAERPPSHPPLRTNGEQPAAANTAAEGQVLDHSMYAVVKYRSQIPAGEQDAVTKKKAEYAAINVS